MAIFRLVLEIFYCAWTEILSFHFGSKTDITKVFGDPISDIFDCACAEPP